MDGWGWGEVEGGAMEKRLFICWGCRAHRCFLVRHGALRFSSSLRRDMKDRRWAAHALRNTTCY